MNFDMLKNSNTLCGFSPEFLTCPPVKVIVDSPVYPGDICPSAHNKVFKPTTTNTAIIVLGKVIFSFNALKIRGENQMIGNEMTRVQPINQNVAFRRLMDEKKSEIEATTKKFVDSEMAIFEFKLCAASLGGSHLNKANQDTLDFTRETMAKAKNLQEYKRLVNFV